MERLIPYLLGEFVYSQRSITKGWIFTAICADVWDRGNFSATVFEPYLKIYALTVCHVFSFFHLISPRGSDCTYCPVVPMQSQPDITYVADTCLDFKPQFLSSNYSNPRKRFSSQKYKGSKSVAENLYICRSYNLKNNSIQDSDVRPWQRTVKFEWVLTCSDNISQTGGWYSPQRHS